MALLEVRDLVVEYKKNKSSFRAVDGVSFTLDAGETLAIVGESGCGKTTIARAVLGLQPFSGTVSIQGVSVEGVRRGQAESVGVVWQDPFASLDPRWSIGDLISEPATVNGKQIDLHALMGRCGLQPIFASRYPHQMSGGQRQRVAIARALALEPPLVICDEPTSALDLSVQAQILNLLKDLQEETHCAYLYISHDLSTVRYLSDRIAVMYLGRIVEEGPTDVVFQNPRHPYTKLLLESALTHELIGKLPVAESKEVLETPQAGCKFLPRCPRAGEECTRTAPALGEGLHRAACFFPHKNEI